MCTCKYYRSSAHVMLAESECDLKQLGGVQISAGGIRLNVVLGCLEPLLLLHIVGIASHPHKHLSIGVQDHHILLYQVLQGEGGGGGG